MSKTVLFQAIQFIKKKLNGSKYCYLSPTVQLNISHVFKLSYMSKQFYCKQFILA